MLAPLARPLDHRAVVLQCDGTGSVVALQTVAELLVLGDPPPTPLGLGSVGMVHGDPAVGLEIENVPGRRSPGAGQNRNNRHEEKTQK